MNRDWRAKYRQNESYWITETSICTTLRNNALVIDSSKSFKSYDRDGKLLEIDDRLFYVYDSLGRVMKELYCLRDCDAPYELLYIYNDRNQLTTKIDCSPNLKDTIAIHTFEYDQSGLLIKETMGLDSLKTIIVHTYNLDSTKKSTTETSFNTNVQRWITNIDSFYYNSMRQMIRKEFRVKNEDMVKISRYEYSNVNVTRRTDTTITSIPMYKPDLSHGTIHHAYYGKEEFEYDSEDRVIKHVIYQPDYRIPYSTTEFRFDKSFKHH